MQLTNITFWPVIDYQIPPPQTVSCVHQEFFMQPLCFLNHLQHTSQLSQIIWESPGYDTIISRSPEQITKSPLYNRVKSLLSVRNLKFIPLSLKIPIFYDSQFSFWGMFALTKIILPLQSYKGIMVCTSCKTSKCPKPFPCDKLETGSNCAFRGGVGH